MALFSEILSRLANRIFPASGSANQVGVKQGDGSIAFSDLKTVGGNSILGSGDIAAGSPYAVASGVNTYAVTIAGITAYSEGASFLIKFTNANTGSSSLNINSLGAKTIKRYGGADTLSGAIPAGAVAELYYDGTNFLMNTPIVLPTVLSGEKALTITSSGLNGDYEVVNASPANLTDLQGATWTNDKCTGVAGYQSQVTSDDVYVYICTDDTGKWDRFKKGFPTVVSGEKALTLTPAGLQKKYDVVEASAANITDLQSATWTDDKCTGVAGFITQIAFDTNYIYYCYDSTGKWGRIPRGIVAIEKRLGDVDDSGGAKTNAALELLYPSASIGQEVKGSDGRFYTKEAAGTWIITNYENCL